MPSPVGPGEERTMAPAKARSEQAEEAQAQPTPANGGGTGRTARSWRESAAGRSGCISRWSRPSSASRDLRLGQPDVGAAAGAAAATVRSLSPAELAYYAGLGLLTVVELIE